MASFFSTDSKLYRFMSRFTELVKISLLWLVFSLPIVTLGISTIAAFTVTLHMADGQEGYVGREFLHAFKSNWKQGIPMSFITLLCIWVLYLDFQLCRAAQENTVLFLIAGIVTAYIFVFSFLYVYPLLARYENTVMNSLKNSFSIGMRYFLRSLLLVFIVAVEVVTIAWNYTTLFVGALVGSGIIMYTISGFAMAIFRELEKIPGTVPAKENTEDTEDTED
ncbi:MAG: DUF624 domain-containing protein [Oscillospiraceae bacterium]|nr:DUF624 domain-containing protein [Oscillospiraceae bacterium]